MMLCRGAKPWESEMHGHREPAHRWHCPSVSERGGKDLIKEGTGEDFKIALGVDEDDKLRRNTSRRRKLYLKDC